jgi:hypothetical protein
MPPAGSRRAVARLAAFAVAAVLAPRPAAAEAPAEVPDARRAVAVLEFRSGSTALPGIDRRIAALLDEETSLELVAGDGARTRYGGRLDADVVACGGEERCIAKLGARLDVDEVLLVGVSEFGDVILTLQRISVGSRAATMRIAEALAPEASPSDPELAGYLRRVMPESDFLQFGTIRVAANIAGAEVFVDRQRRGVTPLDALEVPAPATYVLQVTRRGYTPFRARVAVPPGGEVEVTARLTREASHAWYQRWYVLAAAGVVLAGGVGVGVFLATQDAPDGVPVTGTFD